jgi:predicted MFS family arabinose efflux permease
VTGGGPRLSRQSRSRLARLCALFSLDAIGGGFLATTLLAFFFYERFGIAEATLGPLFFTARVLNASSHLGAAWLARRVGLVNTMVFTHIPGSLLLVGVALAPGFPLAAALFLLREALAQMDVPTRQSYVVAIVRPEERTFAAGVTHLVRLCGWAAAPPLAGLFMQGAALATPLFVGATIKIIYDLALYASFRRLRPAEEEVGADT